MTHVFLHTTSTIYLLLNSIRNPFSQFNHMTNSLSHILNAIKISSHTTSLTYFRAHTKIIGNDEAEKLAKMGAKEPCSMHTPFHCIRHPTLNKPSIPPTSIQHDGLVQNLKFYVENEYKKMPS